MSACEIDEETDCPTENLAVSPLLIATSEGHVEVTCQLAMYNASLDLAGYLKLMGGVQRISPFHVALQHGEHRPRSVRFCRQQRGFEFTSVVPRGRKSSVSDPLSVDCC